MYFESRLQRWAAELRQRTDLPLRLELWNGARFELGASASVILRVPQPGALRYLFKPSLDRLGHAYVEGKIDIEGRAEDIVRVGSALAQAASAQARSWFLPARHTRRQDAAAIRYHYDVSNDFYRAFLDERMVYSCAYFEHGGESLEQAQLQKIDHILTKIRLAPGQRLLDIGCGWGALAMRAAEKYGAHCLGITLSQNQFELARERVARAGLQDRVEIRLQDYRDIDGQFDRITSVGMFEHVGLKNLRAYFACMARLLADEGVAMNHGITSTDSGSAGAAFGASEFIARYVFPHGELPHIGLVLAAMQDSGLEALDVENLRRHYARTCGLWAQNFEDRAEHIRRLVDEKRYRIWRVYLAGCAHAFEQGWVSIHQVLCTKTRGGAQHLPWSRRYMYPG